MSYDGDLLRAVADRLPQTDDPWGWLTALAHELDAAPGLGRLDAPHLRPAPPITVGHSGSLRGAG